MNYEFVRSISNPCVYILQNGKKTIDIALYVDDFLVAVSSPDILDESETYLKTCVKELATSELTKFLGLSITRDRLNVPVSSFKRTSFKTSYMITPLSKAKPPTR